MNHHERGSPQPRSSSNPTVLAACLLLSAKASCGGETGSLQRHLGCRRLLSRTNEGKNTLRNTGMPIGWNVPVGAWNEGI